MALKIDQNCTVYKEQKRAVKVAEYRGMTPRGVIVVKSDDFLLNDTDYPKICENARQRFCKQVGLVDPLFGSECSRVNQPPAVVESPPLPKNDFKIDQLIIPAVLGIAIIGILMVSE